ncbi:hypothetical protein EUX98_g7604 [Antrodiella citrinella]|uniref:O-methyltransferase C-terminal domain-containing protein n=1 Tax=Antrodiella citrinella TaxID=2447956 RepID=A0A4S4ML37_9APHY|nr:hypothetical protein EUX98_g7604 [Antrodiella citrinella]
MEASFAELDALVALITSAVQDVKAEYRRLQYEFPSLDDTKPHPLDMEHTPPKLKRAVQSIHGACAHLSTLVTTPAHTLALRGGDELYKSGIYLSDTLSDAVTGPSLDPSLTSFAAYYKAPLWQFWIENPHSFERFRFSMTGYAWLENMYSVEKGAVPHSLTPCVCTLVNDIGGGLGHMTMHIAKLHPNINVIIQDIEEAVNQAIGYWNGFGPELVANERVDFLPFNFLQEAPVEGCDFYYDCGYEQKANDALCGQIKHILHNWTDDAANIILTNVRKAMKPSARVIIQGYIIQSASEEGMEDDSDLMPRAPKPLLPNYGEGHVIRYYMDIVMMELLNSQQRTLVEYKRLGESAGLEFVKAYDCGELSALEFKLP